MLQSHKNSLESTRKVCPICEEHFYMDDLFSFMMCGDFLCKGCFKRNLDENLRECNFEKIVQCHTCSVDIDSAQLEKFIGNQDIWDKINTFLINRKFAIIECPNINCREQFIPGDARLVICINCQYRFCKFCKGLYHEDGDCKERYIQDRLHEILANNSPEAVTQCPKCRIPYLKDEKCNEVTCNNQDCKVSFCFKCACIRSPILAHGNHYHRPNCPYFHPFDAEEDSKQPDCTECTRLGQLCPRPPNLRVIRLLDPDEAAK